MKCRLCHSDNIGMLFVLPNICSNISYLPEHPSKEQSIQLPVWQCQECGFVQLSAEYQQNVDYSDYYMSASWSTQLQACMEKQAKMLAGLLNCDDTVLEVGCGDGAFLKCLQHYPLQIVGLEPSRAFWQVAITRHQPVINEVLSDQVGFGQYHAVVAREVLEHVADIHSFICSCRYNLYPDGILFLQVPRGETIIDKQRIHNFFPDHLNYFREQDLRLLLAMHGFQVTHIYSDMMDEFTVVIAVNHAINDHLNIVYHSWQRLIQQARNWFANHANQRIVLYGAGGKGVSLIAALQLYPTANLRLVDDDVMKINRFTPVTNFLIESPDLIAEYQPEHIIILAEAYVDEIKAKYPQAPSITLAELS